MKYNNSDLNRLVDNKKKQAWAELCQASSLPQKKFDLKNNKFLVDEIVGSTQF